MDHFWQHARVRGDPDGRFRLRYQEGCVRLEALTAGGASAQATIGREVLIGERFTRAGLKAMFCHEQCDPDQSIAGKGSSASRQNEKSPVSGVMVAKRVLYEGRVQGVGFRFSVKSVTTGYDVVGSVKNLIDGRVEVEVQGEESEVEEFLKAILDSHLRRYINRFVVHDIALKRGVKGFAILP